MPKDLPDGPVLLKQLREQMVSERESDKGEIFYLEEENALMEHCMEVCLLPTDNNRAERAIKPLVIGRKT